MGELKISYIIKDYPNSKLWELFCRYSVAYILLITTSLHLSAQDTYTSTQTGNWGTASTWTGAAGTPGANDTVIILDGHTVSISGGSGESVYSITIDGGGVLDRQNRNFDVGGTFIVNGTVTGSETAAKDISFSGDTLGGTGIIAINNDQNLDCGADVVVLSTAHIHIFGNINIQNGVTVTNKGHLEVYGDVDGANAAGSVWTNDTGSELEAGGSFMDTGILNASATGNTLSYIQQGDQSIKTPNSSEYFNLTISGSNTKTILNNLIIANDLNIDYAILDCGGNNIQIRGNWTNEADFIEGTGTVTFDGTADQTIENVAGEEFHNLTMNKASGILILDGNVQASNNLTLSSGIVNAGSYTLTLGSGLASLGTLTHTSGHINGSFERWTDATGTYSFPVGSSSNDQGLSITINNGLQTGGSLISTYFLVIRDNSSGLCIS